MLSDNTQQTDIPGNYLAALDIGSNSFHFVFARQVDNQLQILHKEKYRVQLASGLNTQNSLSDEAIERGLETLKLLKPTVEKLNDSNFRIVATYTLRTATNSEQFLAAAKAIFPFDIEIISGHEEARLIYQGVAHTDAREGKKLVIDIGGGSTECIIGQSYKTYELVSFNIGCVSMTKEYFADGTLTQAHFEQAIMAAKVELESHLKRFKKCGWQHTLGTSGTVKAIAQITSNNTSNDISYKDLLRLKKQLIKLSTIDSFDNDALKQSRKQTLPGGLAILIAIFEMFELNTLTFHDSALREGVLYEKFDLFQYQDIRERSVDSMLERFSVDKTQADAVSQLAEYFFSQVRESWQLNQHKYAKLLHWACQLHEIGVDINSSGFHKHGQYILTHADLAGFNLEQQTALAWLIGSQRKKPEQLPKHCWQQLKINKLKKLAAILRLTVLLNQQRQLTELPLISLTAQKSELEILICLGFPSEWLEQRPLIQADLLTEQKRLKTIGISLTVSTS